MTGFELDPAAMRMAVTDLNRHIDDLRAHLAEAQFLAQPLPDGHSPVAPQMRKAYIDRADWDNGVQAVLQDYIDELEDIRDNIALSNQTYGDLELGAAADIARTTNGSALSWEES